MNHDSSPVEVYFLLLPLLLTLGGCAGKPWGDIVSGDDINIDNFVPIIEAYHGENCMQSWDADMTVTIDTPLDTKKGAGYLTVTPPSRIKFVASNPLGQPIVIVASDGSYFQFLEVLSQEFTHGKPISYARLSNLPISFVSGNWGLWLSGRLPPTSIEFATLRLDTDDRGLWLSVAEGIIADTMSHYLVDPANFIVKEQILTEKDTITARIEYSNYSRIGSCFQPQNLLVSDLPYDTKISIDLQKIQQTTGKNKKKFFIDVPSGYNTRHLP